MSGWQEKLLRKLVPSWWLVVLWLLGCCVATFGVAWAASAKKPANSNNLASTPITLEADRLERDGLTGVLKAKGSVVLRYEGWELRGEALTYDVVAQRVSSDVPMVVRDPDGMEVTSHDFSLDHAGHRGTLHHLVAHLPNRSSIVARQAWQEGQYRWVFESVGYSACGICRFPEEEAKGGRQRLPWRIRSRQLEIDRSSYDMTYRDAWLEVLGVPVVYTPYFHHPMPASPARSGFLLPKYLASKGFGQGVKIPYYWRIDSRQDVTFETTLFTQNNPLFHIDYRRLGVFTDSQWHGWITKPQRVAGISKEIFPLWRGAVDGKTTYASPVTDWRGTVQVQRASDPTFRKRYLVGDEGLLTSSLTMDRFSDAQYGRVRMMGFQPLLDYGPYHGMPWLAPWLEWYHQGHWGDQGQRLWAWQIDGLQMHRNEGVGMQRLVGQARMLQWFDWKNGQRWLVGTHWHQSLYHTELRQRHGDTTSTGTHQRGVPTLTLGWEWPWHSQWYPGRWLTVEPVLRLFYSPPVRDQSRIPNQDSGLTELTTENLWSEHPFWGQDRVDDRLRLSYGLRLHHYAGSGASMHWTLGQQWRPHPSNQWEKGSGREDRYSDYVTQWQYFFPEHFDVLFRGRMDQKSRRMRRSDTSVGYREGASRIRFGYVLRHDERLMLWPRRETAYGEGEITYGPWNAGSAVSVNLYRPYYGFGQKRQRLSRFERAQVHLGHKHSCFQTRIVLQRDFTRDRDIRPDTYVGLHINLRTLTYEE